MNHRMSPSARHLNQEATSDLLQLLSAEYFIAVDRPPPPQPHMMEEANLTSPSPSYTFLKWQRRAERAKTSETPTQGRPEYLLINNTHSTAVGGLLPFCNPQLVETVHTFALKDISYGTTLHWDVATSRVGRCFGPDWRV